MYTPYAGAAGKWKVQNMKLEIICFVVKKYLSHQTSLSISSCICGIYYFKFNGVDAINILTKL
jgi:hypothetical protein